MPPGESKAAERNESRYSTLTFKPVLIVHSGKQTQEDVKAVELVRSELGDRVLIVTRRGTDPEEDIIPRLFASTSIYRGLENIEGFIRDIRQLKQRQAARS